MTIDFRECSIDEALRLGLIDGIEPLPSKSERTRRWERRKARRGDR